MFEGASIGQYRVLRKIGEGGMGAVFLAEHSLIGRRAAIKLLLPELSQRREVVDRFFNEARATTAVSDPGIVQVFDFGFHDDGSAYIVMELLEGEPLDLRIQRLKTVSVAEALRITRQIAGSLAAAHARGIVHRDLKPDNIFMVPDPEALGGERPKVLDFGIAKLAGDDPGRMRTRTGVLIGTPIYMSPEQCRGTGILDHRSDIYSLGCVLYHMIVGQPPFDLQGMGEIISAHMHEAPKAPSEIAVGIPHGVDELVLRCLAKDADERFQSMLELQAAADVLLARITAPGISAPMVPLATPLGPGFRSVAPGAATGAVTRTRTTLAAAAGSHTVTFSRRTGILIGLGVTLLGGAAIVVLAGSRGSKAEPTPAPVSAPAPAPAPAPTPAPALAPTPIPDPVPPADPAPVTTPPVDAAIPVEHPASVAKPNPKRTVKPKAKDDLYDDR